MVKASPNRTRFLFEILFTENKINTNILYINLTIS